MLALNHMATTNPKPLFGSRTQTNDLDALLNSLETSGGAGPVNPFRFAPKDFLKKAGDRVKFRILSIDPEHIRLVRGRSVLVRAKSGKSYANSVWTDVCNLTSPDSGENVIASRPTEDLVVKSGESLDDLPFTSIYRIPIVVEEIQVNKNTETINAIKFLEVPWSIWQKFVAGFKDPESGLEVKAEFGNVPGQAILITRLATTPYWDISHPKKVVEGSLDQVLAEDVLSTALEEFEALQEAMNEFQTDAAVAQIIKYSAASQTKDEDGAAEATPKRSSGGPAIGNKPGDVDDEDDEGGDETPDAEEKPKKTSGAGVAALLKARAQKG